MLQKTQFEIEDEISFRRACVMSRLSDSAMCQTLGIRYEWKHIHVDALWLSPPLSDADSG